MTIAVITDIHGNYECLKSIMDDIKTKNVDKIICLGDTINLGLDSKKCIDMLIDNDVAMTLGNHELYCIKGSQIDSSIGIEEQKHYEWVKSSLQDKEIDFIKKCPLKYECDITYNNVIPNKKIIFSHYLISDNDADYPFEKNHLKDDVNLWIKYNDSDIFYVIGHLHKSFNINDVDGIVGDFIEETGELTNIEIVNSGGFSNNDEVSYMLIEIKKGISFKKIKVKFDRESLVKRLIDTDFPDKKNILKCFYGIEL